MKTLKELEEPMAAARKAVLRADKKRTELLVGHLDVVSSDGKVEGWAYDKSVPEFPLEIRALEGERLLSKGMANLSRPDASLVSVGEATPGGAGGMSGFRLDLPSDILDGERHYIVVMAKVASGENHILGTAHAVLSIPQAPGSSQDRDDRRELPSRIRESNASLGQPSVRNSVRKEPTVSLEFETASDNRRFIVQQQGPEQNLMKDVADNFLSSALNTALARIDELERSQKGLQVEREALHNRLRKISDEFTYDLNELSSSRWNKDVSARLGNIIHTISITRRRDIWLTEISERNLSGPIYSLMPHGGRSGPLSILVTGSGGIGDMLYLSTVVRELFLTFSPCTVFVLHENPAVEEVFANNPYVSGVVSLQGREFYDFVQMLHCFDIFDLVAEVRYCVTYTAPPLSRVSHEFLSNANFRSADWQKYVRYRWPHLNNAFSNEVMARGLTKLDLVGLTSLLPINSLSEIDFFLAQEYPDLLVNLSGSPFVTIHHGSDKRMARSGGVQTKNLPTSTWTDIVSRLFGLGFKVVQLGESHEQLVEGIDIDLRGKTSLAQTAYVLKAACVHIDTEGGLVHMARAVHTQCVVAFGPTPAPFFGYPQNLNIAPPVCGSCWWTTDRWATSCPRDLDVPECMATQSPEVIADNVVKLANCRRYTIGVVDANRADMDIHSLSLRAIAATNKKGAGAALFGRTSFSHHLESIADLDVSVTFFVHQDVFMATLEGISEIRQIRPYSDASIGRNSMSFDWVVANGLNSSSAGFVSICLETLRCLVPGGRAFLGVELPPQHSPEDVLTLLEQAGPNEIGAKYTINRADVVARKRAGAAIPKGKTIVIEVDADTMGAKAEPGLRRGNGTRVLKSMREPDHITA